MSTAKPGKRLNRWSRGIRICEAYRVTTMAAERWARTPVAPPTISFSFRDSLVGRCTDNIFISEQLDVLNIPQPTPDSQLQQPTTTPNYRQPKSATVLIRAGNRPEYIAKKRQNHAHYCGRCRVVTRICPCPYQPSASRPAIAKCTPGFLLRGSSIATRKS